MQIFLRLSMIMGAVALLIFSIRAATAQEPSAPPGAQADPYGLVPVQNAQPNSQPYGIKPIPGYSPPAPVTSPSAPPASLPAASPMPASPMPASPTPASSAPDALRGSVADTPAIPTRQTQDNYGYVPLRKPMPIAAPGKQPPDNYGYVPLRPAEHAPLQPPLRASTASDDRDNVNRPAAMPGTARQIAYLPTDGNRSGAYRLGPGDKVRVTVFGESDLSGEYQVDGSGMVRLPLIGTLQAAGVTEPALEQNITAALEDGYIKNPRVNVEITLYRPFYIIGAVNRPGQYAYVDHMSALNAVALAGGFTDQAIQSTIYVRHEGSTTEQAMETSQLAEIQPGDVVRVRTSPFWEAMNLFSPVAGPAAIAAAAWH